MPSPLMFTVIAGVTIATVLFFMFREQPEPRYSYDHQRTQECQQRSSSYQRRRLRPANDDVCTICLDSFIEGDYYFLPCQHAFHRQCVRQLQDLSNMRALCPVCRRTIPRMY